MSRGSASGILLKMLERMLQTTFHTKRALTLKLGVQGGPTPPRLLAQAHICLLPENNQRGDICATGDYVSSWSTTPFIHHSFFLAFIASQQTLDLQHLNMDQMPLQFSYHFTAQSALTKHGENRRPFMCIVRNGPSPKRATGVLTMMMMAASNIFMPRSSSSQLS